MEAGTKAEHCYVDEYIFGSQPCGKPIVVCMAYFNISRQPIFGSEIKLSISSFLSTKRFAIAVVLLLPVLRSITFGGKPFRITISKKSESNVMMQQFCSFPQFQMALSDELFKPTNVTWVQFGNGSFKSRMILLEIF